MKVIEPSVIHHIQNGVLEGKDIESYTKRYHEVNYLYEKQREDDPIVYEVYSYSKGKDILGNLNWGLTVLKPVYSHNECNMTKGHFHVNKDCAEIYFGIAGVGLLLLMDEEGDEDLKVGACWPTSAGHDYHAIEKREFGYRVYKRNGQIEFEKR